LEAQRSLELDALRLDFAEELFEGHVSRVAQDAPPVRLTLIRLPKENGETLRKVQCRSVGQIREMRSNALRRLAVTRTTSAGCLQDRLRDLQPNKA
jgi:hypothetical protein